MRGWFPLCDERGEHSFAHWRDRSAAPDLLQGTGWIDRVGAGIVYLSGMTLQLMSDSSLRELLDRLMELLRNGTRVVFDNNYREPGWDSVAQARAAMDLILGVTDVALVTLADEIALGVCLDFESCVARLSELGVVEIVVKDGANGAWVHQEGGLVHLPTRPIEPVDTTAAGDSFNGAYIAARVAGKSATQAAQVGNAVARRVVSAHGAIVDLAQQF